MAHVKEADLLQEFLLELRSRGYRFTHMNRSTVDIPFLSEALSGETIWVILKIATGGEEINLKIGIARELNPGLQCDRQKHWPQYQGGLI